MRADETLGPPFVPLMQPGDRRTDTDAHGNSVTYIVGESRIYIIDHAKFAPYFDRAPVLKLQPDRN